MKRFSMILLAVILGLSNCGCNFTTFFISLCIGYTIADVVIIAEEIIEML